MGRSGGTPREKMMRKTNNRMDRALARVIKQDGYLALGKSPGGGDVIVRESMRAGRYLINTGYSGQSLSADSPREAASIARRLLSGAIRPGQGRNITVGHTDADIRFVTTGRGLFGVR